MNSGSEAKIGPQLCDDACHDLLHELCKLPQTTDTELRLVQARMRPRRMREMGNAHMDVALVRPGRFVRHRSRLSCYRYDVLEVCSCTGHIGELYVHVVVVVVADAHPGGRPQFALHPFHMLCLCCYVVPDTVTYHVYLLHGS